jgi:hypothetical protein
MLKGAIESKSLILNNCFPYFQGPPNRLYQYAYFSQFNILMINGGHIG